MKAKYIFAVLALLALAAWFVLRPGAKADADTQTLPNPEPLPPPPPPPASQATASPDAATPLLIDQEPARTAVNARAQQVLRDAAIRPQLMANLDWSNRLFQGTQYPAGLRLALQSTVGGEYNLPVLNDAQQGQAANLKDQQGFERLRASVGFDQAQSQWAQALDFGSFSLWPPNIAVLIDQGAFGQAGRADRDKSERYDAFTTDVKRMATNWASLNADLLTAARERAARDLVAAGWKIVGY